MSVSRSVPLVKDLPPQLRERDPRGRFLPGNRLSSAGGRARANKLPSRRRRAIARKGYRAMVKRHFGGDARAQRRYLVRQAVEEFARWTHQQRSRKSDSVQDRT